MAIPFQGAYLSKEVYVDLKKKMYSITTFKKEKEFPLHNRYFPLQLPFAPLFIISVL